MAKSNGVILWEGPSALSAAVAIVVIAVGLRGSSNRKTGSMLQTYILLQDIAPVEAVKTGADAAICGDCVHRGDGFKQRTCYVNVGQGPRSVWDCYKRGGYPTANTPAEIRAIGSGRKVRLGTYGDPMAAPAKVWKDLTKLSTMHTGYTHQWKGARGKVWQSLVMASADTPNDAVKAQAKSFRTFRVNTDAVKLAGEVICPASAEAGKILQCATCGACNGTRTERKGSITIRAHGSQVSAANLIALDSRIIARA